jgi:hypothetical protein
MIMQCLLFEAPTTHAPWETADDKRGLTARCPRADRQPGPARILVDEV